MYNGSNIFCNQGYQQHPRYHKPTKKEIRDYIVNQLNPSEVINVDDFETLNTRHICRGSKVVSVLGKQVYSVPMQVFSDEMGYINVEIVFCPTCRKLLINKSSLDLV